MINLGLFIASLTTTLAVCFILPILTIGLLLGLLTMAEFSPMSGFGQTGLNHTLDILSIFGGGSVWEGVLTISLTLSLVGGMFDTYAFCRYQGVRQ